MLIKDIAEAETIINLLSPETKQKSIVDINLLLVNFLSQQNAIDPLLVLNKILVILPKDVQQKLISELNVSLIKALTAQATPIFSIIQKLGSALNEDSKQKMLSETSIILQNSIKNNNAPSQASAPPPPSIPTMGAPNPPSPPPPSFQSPNLPPIPPAQPQIQQNPNMTPAIPFNAGLTGANTVKKFVPSMQTPAPPPTASQLMNTTSEIKFSKGLTLTGTFNLKPKDPVDKNSQKQILPVQETLKYIIAIPTEASKKALANLSTPVEVYQFVKICDGFKSLSALYTEGYSNITMVNFIYKVYSMYMAKYVLFKRSNDMPQDKEPRLRIGEWLAFLGHIPAEKLDKIIQLHQVSVSGVDAATKARAAARSGANYENVETKGPLFGNFLLDSEIINKAQLNEALMVQLQFNEILAALR